MKKTKQDNETRIAMIDTYSYLVANVSKFPTRKDLLDSGITRDKVRHHFINVAGLRKAAKEANPDIFAGVVYEEDLTTEKALKVLQKEVSKYKRFIITSAVNGQSVHPGFWETLQNYSEKHNAKILIRPCQDPAHNLDNDLEWHFDDALAESRFVFSELRFNSNIHMSSISVNAKQINPETGLARFVQKKGSTILGSPKQSLEYTPVSNVKYPHAVMTTGAVTLPNYKTSRSNSLRSAFIAHHDHVIGAIILEIEDDKLYHFRQIQSDEDGGFCDLGKYYYGNTVKKVTPKLVMGDYHAGQHDDTAVNAWIEAIDLMGIDEVFFHDVFNGRSINHHEETNIILRAKLSAKNSVSLKNELNVTGDQIDRVTSRKSVKKAVIIKSNHDEFLIRWLQEGKFKYDPVNFQVGCKLADLTVDGKDPLIEGLKMYSSFKTRDKVKFLSRDEDYKIAGIELGAHGDKGPNGSRGSKQSLERAYGACVIGHSHTPGILRGVYQVGTTSLFDLDYNVGASSWMHCSCLVYENGQRQLINSIDGKWRLKD